MIGSSVDIAAAQQVALGSSSGQLVAQYDRPNQSSYRIAFSGFPQPLHGKEPDQQQWTMLRTELGRLSGIVFHRRSSN
jgi:hypothetical protein